MGITRVTGAVFDSEDNKMKYASPNASLGTFTTSPSMKNAHLD